MKTNKQLKAASNNWNNAKNELKKQDIERRNKRKNARGKQWAAI